MKFYAIIAQKKYLLVANAENAMNFFVKLLELLNNSLGNLCDYLFKLFRVIQIN